jgi:hypothetical protein
MSLSVALHHGGLGVSRAVAARPGLSRSVASPAEVVAPPKYESAGEWQFFVHQFRKCYLPDLVC